MKRLENLAKEGDSLIDFFPWFDQDPIWAKALTNVVSDHSCQIAINDFNIGTNLSNRANVQGP